MSSEIKSGRYVKSEYSRNVGTLCLAADVDGLRDGDPVSIWKDSGHNFGSISTDEEAEAIDYDDD